MRDLNCPGAPRLTHMHLDTSLPADIDSTVSCSCFW